MRRRRTEVWSDFARSAVGLAVAGVLSFACRSESAGDERVPDADSGADAAPPAPTATSTSGPDTRAEPPQVRFIAESTEVATVAGSDAAGFQEGTGASARFENPVGVLLDPSGGLLVTEYDGYRLRKIDATGATSTVATGLPEPFALTAGKDAIYVQTDRDPEGNKGDTTGSIWRVGVGGGGAPELVITHLGRPRGLATLADGRIVVSDRTRNMIEVLDPATKTLTPLAGSGLRGFADGRGQDARFDDPYGIALLPDGTLLVAEFGNHCIRRVTLDGQVSLFAGDRNPGMRDHTDRYQARFDNPGDVAIDALGNVFVSDRGNHRIRRISPAGAVETVAGDGVRGFADGAGQAARFYGQEQIEVSPDGKTLYVSDGSSGEADVPFHRVRQITIE